MIKFESVEIPFTDYTKQEIVSEGKLNSNIFIQEKCATEQCIDTLKSFHEKKIEDYVSGDIAERKELIQNLHTSFCDTLGTNSKLKFEPMSLWDMGYHDPDTNVVAINDMLLESEDPKEIIMTDLHEIRHDFQDKAVRMPFSVDVDESIISIWKENFENYISPEFDFEEYSKQPIEVDANNFAALVFDNAINIYRI